ncbi:hypothetical protein AMST5_01103 [freshwater sediment metagenome]|uniref:Uncharacterized protein n=1 Tax=freshwater sediment metagenome TaxID=556182 RepID=A0AA48LXY7_9ZZZZ
MSRFNKALLASASFAILASAAHAQTLLDAMPLLPIVPPPTGVNQDIAATWYKFEDFRADPIYVTNIAGAFTNGTGPATSEVFQIAANTLNQFGSAGAAVTVLGDYSVSQNYSYGNNNNISVLNSNGAFSAGGFSTAAGSQLIATAINNTAVDNGKGGQTFEISQVYAPDVNFLRIGDQNIRQQNSITAGYDTNRPNVGTGGAAINGVELPGNTGTNHAGLQANSLTINTASVNLFPGAFAFGYPAEDLKIFQAAVLNTNIDLFNVADAGSQDLRNPPPPPPGGRPPIDPSINNLQQIAAVTINSATLTGEPLKFPPPGPGGDIPASFNLKAAFVTTTNPDLHVPNQTFAAAPFGRVGADITLFNVAHALTWTNGAYTGPGVEWDPKKAGTGDVQIGGVIKDGAGGVKQIVALTINSVSGDTSVDGGPVDRVNVFAGTVETSLTSQTPKGLTSFWQAADLSGLDFNGRPGGNYDGGAGIQNSFVDFVDVNAFPSYAGSLPIPVPPSHFDWDDAQNTAIAGTGVGNATIRNTDQVVALTVNNFSFDNSVKDADGKIKKGFENTDTVSGAILQTATLSGFFGRPNEFTLANVAEALTGRGTATLDTVNQTNVFSVNSFTAGEVDFVGTVKDPLDSTKVLDTGRLVQSVNTGGAILNLGNLAVARGTVANITDTKQINAVSLNTGTIGSISGGGISQSVVGGLNVNAGNYLQATGTISASINNATQVSVVNVNSISGYAH